MVCLFSYRDAVFTYFILHNIGLGVASKMVFKAMNFFYCLIHSCYFSNTVDVQWFSAPVTWWPEMSEIQTSIRCFAYLCHLVSCGTKYHAPTTLINITSTVGNGCHFGFAIVVLKQHSSSCHWLASSRDFWQLLQWQEDIKNNLLKYWYKMAELCAPVEPQPAGLSAAAVRVP